MFVIAALFVGTVLLQLLHMRGGAFHNLLVAEAVSVFDRHGFETVPECPVRLPDGRTDFVDLLATRDTTVIACEIETTPRNALFNIRRADAARLPLFVIVPTRAVRATVCRQVASVVVTSESGRKKGGVERIWILLPDELPQALTNCFPLISPANGAAKTK